MRVLVFNQKGGVGKTTSAVNLAAALVRFCDQTATLIDLDPQMHLTFGLGYTEAPITPNVSDWMADSSVNPISVKNEGELHLIPGNPDIDFSGEVVLPSQDDENWLILDAAPAWSPMIASLMRQVDFVLTPLEPDFLGLQGINGVIRSMQDAGIDQSKLRILLCRFNGRQTVHREVRSRLAERFGTETLAPLVVRNSVRLSEAQGNGMSVFNHAPDSTGAQDYSTLARFFVDLANQKPGKRRVIS